MARETNNVITKIMCRRGTKRSISKPSWFFKKKSYNVAKNRISLLPQENYKNINRHLRKKYPIIIFLIGAHNITILSIISSNC